MFFFEKFFLFSIMYDVANTFFSAFYEFLWGFLEFFLKFLCVISGVFFCMYVVVVEAIIYGGIFRSNCENFESFFLKIDRNGEENFLCFFLKIFFLKRALSHFFLLLY